MFFEVLRTFSASLKTWYRHCLRDSEEQGTRGRSQELCGAPKLIIA